VTRRRGTRWAVGLLLVLVGVAIGVAGAFVQAQRLVLDTPWGLTAIPWGVPVVWITLVAAIRGGVWGLGTRWGGWAVAAGWLVATVAASAESPSGDVALSGGGRQLAYLLGGVILASAAASLALPAAASREPSGEGPRNPVRL
jgi:hypothetical protein